MIYLQVKKNTTWPKKENNSTEIYTQQNLFFNNKISPGKALETQTEMLVEEEPDIGKENNNNFSNDQVRTKK